MTGSRLWSWRVLRLHLTLVVLCVSFGMLANWQIHRALSGNTLSWAYAFEWPLFIVYAIVLWRRLLLDELYGDTRKVSTRRLPLPSCIVNYQRRRVVKLQHRGLAEDLERERYNSYLAGLRAEEGDAPSPH